MTRSREKLESLRDLGAEPVLCDVYDYETLQWVTQQVGPQIIVNFLTDLSSGSAEANNRVRREGGGNLLKAARITAADRFVVESVAFALDGDAAQAVEQLEQATREFAGESVILRFGRFWGPGHELPNAAATTNDPHRHGRRQSRAPPHARTPGDIPRYRDWRPVPARPVPDLAVSARGLPHHFGDPRRTNRRRRRRRYRTVAVRQPP